MKKNTAQFLQGELLHNQPLAKYTSWKVGGAADKFYRPKDLQDLQKFLSTLSTEEPITFLGLGSNVLIRDGGIRGTVIHTLNRLNKIELLDDNAVRVEAGVPSAKLAKFCVEHGFVDGAFFAGIPGTVGGALFMNAGAFGGETWPHVKAVEVMDRSGNIEVKSVAEFQYSYRHVSGLGDCCFVAAHFQFEKGDSATVQADIKSLLKKRSDTQPVGTFNCGSVFRNPDGDHAARLIESCGLKGFAIGDAVVSEKHANFIVNQGRASAADLEQLIRYVHDTVQQKTGVDLVRECIVLGTRND